ncbi:type III secretion protein, partial [Paracidovorax cattleyae]
MSRARDLARLACELQARIDALPEHVDPSWLRPASDPTLPPQVQETLSKDWFARHCGPLPPLERLEDGGARLALMDRTSLLARLCALALLGRPGVLRCCVQRSARMALQEALGPAFA